MHAGQRGDQLRGAGDRQVVRAHRQCRAGVDPRPYCTRPVTPSCADARPPRTPGIASPEPGTPSPPAAGAARPRTPAVSASPRPRIAQAVSCSSRTPPARTPPCDPGGPTAPAAPPRRAACRACGRTCWAATGPSASLYTGCPTTAASMTSRSPSPGSAPGPRPSRPAPRSARPAPPAALRPAHPWSAAACRSRALTASSSVTRARSRPLG